MMPRVFRFVRALALPVLLVSLVTAPAWGSDVVGWVQKAEGEVSLIDPDGASRPAEVKAEVMARDTVATGEDGRTQIVFTDETLLALGENSRLVVNDAMDMDGGGRFELRFIEGVARVLTSGVVSSNPDRFEMETTLGAIGIRGTEFGSLVAADHETHLLYEGGPVVYEDRQEGAGGEDLVAEACLKLDEARERAEFAISGLKVSQTKTRQKMQRIISDVEEKQTRLGCGQ